MSEYNNENIYSKRLRAGKRRTYFFDVRTTKNNDYFVTLTESKKRFDEDGYDRHKIFLYKEDFNKFIEALTETINHVKTELMPDFDFDAFNHDDQAGDNQKNTVAPEPIEDHTPDKAIEIETAVSQAEDLVAQELTSKVENINQTTSDDTENPSAADEAETW